MVIVAKDVPVNISGKEVRITIYRNKEGNLVLDGVGSVTHEMINDELILMRYED
ncbi:hypothetical protein ACTFR8_22450 [Bacillus cereus group sp. MYBK15-3]|uniref:hypothetical protein n=1 Tax=Bacillus cereus group TaxID=86661 RepID=UPI001C8C8A89|nr:hypothetical protein [Bacillus cereus]MBX9158362.1 hypothetical protein [Bacillus cereus]